MNLFCTSGTAINNPMDRGEGGRQGRSFCILDQGEMEGVYGYWCENDEDGDVGFIGDTDDVFWTWNDSQWCWLTRRVPGRSFRRGPPKGGGKGKGSKGGKGFTPFRPKGKGKEKGGPKGKLSLATETEENTQPTQDTAAWASIG